MDDADLWARFGETIDTLRMTWDEIIDHRHLSPAKHIPPLPLKAADVYELLCELPTHRGLSAPDISQKLSGRGIDVSEEAIRGPIFNDLKPYGMNHKRGAGYYLRT